MAKAHVGAYVRYCGHEAYFIADIWKIGNANVVKANGPLTDKLLMRDEEGYNKATHQLVDFPSAGYWRPYLGIFVVPEEQVTEVKTKNSGLSARDIAIREGLVVPGDN